MKLLVLFVTACAVLLTFGGRRPKTRFACKNAFCLSATPQKTATFGLSIIYKMWQSVSVRASVGRALGS
jgi:hypothetical protein